MRYHANAGAMHAPEPKYTVYRMRDERGRPRIHREDEFLNRNRQLSFVKGSRERFASVRRTAACGSSSPCCAVGPGHRVIGVLQPNRNIPPAGNGSLCLDTVLRGYWTSKARAITVNITECMELFANDMRLDTSSGETGSR